MIRPIYWILLVVAGAAAAVVLSLSIAARTTPPTIQSASIQDHLAVITTSLKSLGIDAANYNLQIADVQYIGDTVAVVRADDSSGRRINFLLELHGDTLYLTNYTTSESFADSELNNPNLTQFINAILAT